MSNDAASQPGLYPTEEPDPTPTLETEAPSATDDALYAWFAEQQTKSVDNIEQAARQIIALCGTLLTVLLGLVALTSANPPGYLQWWVIQWLSLGGVVGLFLALASALTVVIPNVTTVTLNEPDKLTDAWRELLTAKSIGLTIAVLVFGVAMLCITGVIVGALWFVFGDSSSAII